MGFPLVIPAFVAGFLTFLAPCTLPLVPGYLGFISGVSLEDLKDPAKSKAARGKIFMNGIFFVVGFSLVFIILGSIAGFIGRGLLPYRYLLARIGGIFVIIFGLLMLNVFKVPALLREYQFRTLGVFARGKPVNSLILGSAFGFGWTPCVGPILGSILVFASTSATVLSGAFLLFVFSLGLAIPFLLIAAGIGGASRFVAEASRYLNIVSVIGGLFLILLGILMATGNFALWTSWVYRFFAIFNYEGLLNYL